MFLAYMKYGTVKYKGVDPATKFAVIGKDSEDIAEKAKEHGTEPYFTGSMYELNDAWNTCQ